MLHSHRAHWHSLQTALQQWAHGAGALPIRFLQLGGFLLVFFFPLSPISSFSSTRRIGQPVLSGTRSWCLLPYKELTCNSCCAYIFAAVNLH